MVLAVYMAIVWNIFHRKNQHLHQNISKGIRVSWLGGLNVSVLISFFLVSKTDDHTKPHGFLGFVKLE